MMDALLVFPVQYSLHGYINIELKRKPSWGIFYGYMYAVCTQIGKICKHNNVDWIL